jgi:hypothetical protein
MDVGDEAERRAPRTQRWVHAAQRAALGALGLWAGALALALLAMPRATIRALLEVNLPGPAVALAVLYGGMRLGVALVALVSARAPKPPRALVWALVLALGTTLLGLAFARAVDLPPKEVHPFWRIAGVDGAFALWLLLTAIARIILRRTSQ